GLLQVVVLAFPQDFPHQLRLEITPLFVRCVGTECLVDFAPQQLCQLVDEPVLPILSRLGLGAGLWFGRALVSLAACHVDQGDPDPEKPQVASPPSRFPQSFRSDRSAQDPIHLGMNYVGGGGSSGSSLISYVRVELPRLST